MLAGAEDAALRLPPTGPTPHTPCHKPRETFRRNDCARRSSAPLHNGDTTGVLAMRSLAHRFSMLSLVSYAPLA